MENKDLKKKEAKEKYTGRHRLGFWLSVVTAGFIFIGMTILIALPYVMEWQAERLLVRFGARNASISDINFNPMTGYLEIYDVQVQGPGGDRLSMENLVVKLNLFPIIKKRVHFSRISLTGFYIDVRQNEDKSITFAGLNLPEKNGNRENGPGKNENGPIWGFGLKNLDIKDFSIHLVTPELDETVVLTHLSSIDFATWEPDSTGEHVLRADLLGGSLDLEVDRLSFSGPISVTTRVGIREISLERIVPHLDGNLIQSATGSISGRGQVDFTLTPQPAPAFSSTLKFDLYTRDSTLKTVTESSEVELEPGALNLGVFLNSALEMGDNPSKKVTFSFTAELKGTNSRIDTDAAVLQTNHESFSLDVKGSYSDTGSFDPARLNANANLSIRDLFIRNGERTRELLQLGSLDMDNAEIKGPDNIRVALIRAADLSLLSRPAGSIGKGEPEQALSLGVVETSGIGISGLSRLAVEEIKLDSLRAWVTRDKGGELEVMHSLKDVMSDETEGKRTTSLEGSQSAFQAVKPDSKNNNFMISVNKFTLSGENSLAFRDLAVEPAFNLNIDSLGAQILNIKTGENDAQAHVTVNAGMGKYSSVNMEGTVSPPWGTPDVNLQVNIKSIDLPPLTPYTKRYLGYTLRSGHLDAKLDVKVTNGSLDSQADIVVNRIEMNAVKEEDEQRAEERLGIPVNTALSLLKDKNDDIKLTLPVEGDMNDPEFQISDIIVSATGLALKKGVTAYYKDLGATLLTGGLIPPGTFSIFGKLFSGATAMTFEPVTFDPLTVQLDESDRAHLDLLAEKLSEKPKVRLVLCGKVTKEDIVALRQADYEAALAKSQTGASAGTSVNLEELPAEIALSPEAESEPDVTASAADDQEAAAAGPPTLEEMPLSEEEEGRLIELAKQRALMVKDYLTEDGGLDPERLFVCYSEVDAETVDLPPRVDLSI